MDLDEIRNVAGELLSRIEDEAGDVNQFLREGKTASASLAARELESLGGRLARAIEGWEPEACSAS